MLISFIVPVYNVEAYLKECINSILEQSFADYEIVLVDDGSTDNSGNLCDEYREKDVRINVIHKDNGGLSDARNAGIHVAKGKYILFVDSDDYIGKNSISNIVKYLKQQKEEPDIMFLEAIRVYPDGTEDPLGDGYVASCINGKNKKDVMEHLASLPKFPAAAWSKLVKRKFLIQNSLFFEKGLLSEDIDWTIKMILKAKKFAYCDVNYYYYRQNRNGSISNTFDEKSIESLMYIIKKWADREEKRAYQAIVNTMIAYEYMIALNVYAKMPRIYRKKVIDDLIKYQWVMDYARSRKTKITYLLCKIAGVQIASHILKTGDKVRRLYEKIRRKIR